MIGDNPDILKLVSGEKLDIRCPGCLGSFPLIALKKNK